MRRKTLSLPVLVLLTACGYAGDLRRTFLGGISSTGNESDDDSERPESSDADVSPAPGGLPEVPAPHGAPLDCKDGKELVGQRFALASTSPQPPATCKDQMAPGADCLVAVTFAEPRRAELRYVDDRASSNAFDRCGEVVRLSFEREVGLKEVHELRLTAQGTELVHVGTGRVFVRVPTN